MGSPELNWTKPRRVTIVTDSRGWFDPFADALEQRLTDAGDTVSRALSQAEIREGDVAFYLSCTQIAKPETMALHALNVVVHASDLPKDRGFSPIVWSILEGASEIVVSAIEMTEKADEGDILLQRRLRFDGHELNTELRDDLGRMVCTICEDLMAQESPPVGRPQVGEPTWRRRRGPEDSALDPNKTIAEQFDLLRVVDNDRYPAFFDHRGTRYILKISKDESIKGDDQ